MGRAKEACATVSMSVWVDPEGTNRLCYKQASGTNEKRRLNGARVDAASVLRAALRVAPVDDAALLAEHAALLASVGPGPELAPQPPQQRELRSGAAETAARAGVGGGEPRRAERELRAEAVSPPTCLLLSLSLARC